MRYKGKMNFLLAGARATISLALLSAACSSGSTASPMGTTTGSETGATTGDGEGPGTGGTAGAEGMSGGASSSAGGQATDSGGGDAGSGSGGDTGNATGGAVGSGGQSGNCGDRAAGADPLPPPSGTTFVYIGSGSWGGDNGLISVYTIDRTSKTLTFVSEHPAGGLASSLVIDEQAGRLYAGDESKNGVNSFTIDKTTGSLTSLGATSSSNAPVYVSLSPDRKFLLAANYGEGNVDVYPIGDDGKAQASLGATSTGAEAHCILVDAQNHVLVANKGSSTLSHFDFAAGTLTAAAPPTTNLSSPRHIFATDGRAYVVAEGADAITAFDVGADGSLTKDWEVPRLAAGGSAANDSGADIHVTSNGRFLYASNRGAANNIVAYDIGCGEPQLIEHESTQGTTPRNFDLDPFDQFLVVGNREGGSVVVFNIAADGQLNHASTLDVAYEPFFIEVVQF